MSNDPIQPAQSYRATVWLVKQNGEAFGDYTTEARYWENVALDIMSWLRIEVLPYWKPDDIALVWDNNGLDMRLSGALWGIAISHRLRPTWWVPPAAPDAWEPRPDVRANHYK